MGSPERACSRAGGIYAISVAGATAAGGAPPRLASAGGSKLPARAGDALRHGERGEEGYQPDGLREHSPRRPKAIRTTRSARVAIPTRHFAPSPSARART